jgi:hypothetical protein
LTPEPVYLRVVRGDPEPESIRLARARARVRKPEPEIGPEYQRVVIVREPEPEPGPEPVYLRVVRGDPEPESIRLARARARVRIREPEPGPEPVCSPTAARQLASRARRRVRGAATVPDADPTQQRAVVDAFLTAARGGDFEGLLAVLDPDVVLRADSGAVPVGATREVRGAAAVAEQSLTFTRRVAGFAVQHALVNGAAGILSRAQDGQPISVMGFTIRGRKIVEIDVLADLARLQKLDLTVLNG